MMLVMAACPRGASLAGILGVHGELEEMASLFVTAMIQMQHAPFMLEPGSGVD
jgi:hypothetical protein